MLRARSLELLRMVRAPFGPPRGRPVAIPLALMVAGLAGTFLVTRALGRIDTALVNRPAYDLVVDWNGARAFWEGFNPYSPEGLVRSGLARIGIGHPPTTFFWILPLARFDLGIARAVLGQLSLLLLFFELKLLADELRAPWPWTTAWLALGLVLSCDWVDYLIYLGQISQLIAFAYLLAWYCLRRGWDARAGLAVGAACTMKFYPAILLGLMVLGRRWTALAAAAAVYLFVAALMTARFGLSSWGQYARPLQGIADQWMASIQNQSIHGFVLRFFQPTCRPRGPTLPLATALSTLGSVALLAGAAWLSRRAIRKAVRAGGDDEVDLPFALWAVLSVFLSNWAWEHYNLLFLLPLAVLAANTPRLVSWGYGTWTMGAFSTLVVLVAVALAVPILEKATVQNAWAGSVGSGRSLGLHVRLHFYEALNMVPVLGLLASLGTMLWMRERWWGRRSAQEPPVAASPHAAAPESE
jgi:hypothetical protein